MEWDPVLGPISRVLLLYQGDSLSSLPYPARMGCAGLPSLVQFGVGGGLLFIVLY